MNNTTPDPHRYPFAVRKLHWLLAFLLFGLLAVGWYMAELPKEDPNKYMLYPWHKSFGLLALLLGVVRLLVRYVSHIPALPMALAEWERVLSRLVHVAMYVAALLMPLSGYLMSATYPGGKPVQFFGLTIPDVITREESLSHMLHECHEITAWVLVLLIGLHIAGALKHRFIDRENDVIPRIL